MKNETTNTSKKENFKLKNGKLNNNIQMVQKTIVQRNTCIEKLKDSDAPIHS
jgi:hypothetical protein